MDRVSSRVAVIALGMWNTIASGVFGLGGAGGDAYNYREGVSVWFRSIFALNPDTHEVSRGIRDVVLTQREFELLEYLMRNERIVISRQRLLDEVWGYDPFSTTNTIEVFVSNLRRKLEADGDPRLLHTIRGAGYVLRA